jgi:hypothetical protein
MATIYFIGTRPHVNGRHYIHREDCPLLPSPGKRVYLGTFESPEEAMEEGRNYFDNPGTCRFCMHHADTEGFEISGAGEKPDFITLTAISDSWESALVCGVN